MPKMRVRVGDDAGKLAVLTYDKIGRTRSLTPEGFLLCTDVPVARTGEMLYGPGEIPVKPGPDGVARVSRGADVLFAPETLASLKGKSLTDEHPEDDVDPENWNELTLGIVLDPRMGDGDLSDCIVVDLLVTNAEAIKKINDENKVELSAGYDADYEDLGGGRGEQTKIIFNHVALVDRGRCGPRCSIGDHQQPLKKEHDMGARTTVKQSSAPGRRVEINDAIRRAFRDAEAQALEAMGLPPAEDADPGSPEDGKDTHIHLHMGGSSTPAATTDEPEAGAAPAGGDIESRVGALEDGMSQIIDILTEMKANQGGVAHVPSEDEEDPTAAAAAGGEEDLEDGEGSTAKGKTGDSAALHTAFQQTVALAEVLVPGFRVPTFDSKATRKKTVDMMCALRRRALDAVATTDDGQTLIASVSGAQTAPDVATLDCATVKSLFVAAAGAKSLLNNRKATGDASRLPENNGAPAKAKAPMTLAEINAFNQKYYADKAGK